LARQVAAYARLRSYRRGFRDCGFEVDDRFPTADALAALGAIGDADLGRGASVAVFLVFVIAAQSVHLGAIGISILAPDRSREVLDGMNAWLERRSRALLIGLSAVFGASLIARSLAAFGIV
jgi:hypothetical protein